MYNPYFLRKPDDIIVFGIVYLAWIILESISTIRSKYLPKDNTYDRSSRLVMGGSLFISIFIGFSIAFNKSEWNLIQNHQMVFDAGIFLMLCGISLRLYAIRVLGNYFTRTVIIQEGQKVVEDGPYRYIRHPTYSGLILTLIGLGLTLTNWLSVSVIFLGSVMGIIYRVYVEEQALVSGLGQPYQEYMRRTNDSFLLSSNYINGLFNLDLQYQ